MTDIEKYKSVAVKIDCYQKAKPMAEEKYMSIGAFIRYLIDIEYDAHPDKPKLINGDDIKTVSKKKSVFKTKRKNKNVRAKRKKY